FFQAEDGIRDRNVTGVQTCALPISIALYVALSFRRQFQLIRQLLLLIASIITGSLLALFGQVYQTGADTWQLFFAWAILITPWEIGRASCRERVEIVVEPEVVERNK